MIKPDVSIMVSAQGNVDGILTSVFSARLPLIGENIRKSITATDNPGRKDDLWEEMVQDKRQFEDYVYYLEEQAKEFIGLIKTYNQFMGIPEPEPLPTIEPSIDTQISNENTDLTVQNKGVMKL